MSTQEITTVIVVAFVLIFQSIWLFLDARKRGHNYWFWGIWGLIQAPFPTIFYFIFARNKFHNLGRAFMENLKYIMIAVAIIGQIIGAVFLFINTKVAIVIYVIYGIALVLLFLLLIIDRLKEKKEDDGNDYSDY